MKLKGQAFLYLDGEKIAVWPNTIWADVFKDILDKVIDNSDYDDSLVPTRLALQAYGGDNFSYNFSQPITGRNFGIDGSDSYIEFVANGFYPTSSDLQPVVISQVFLMSDNKTLAQADSQDGNLYPNPNIRYYQHVQIKYRITLSGAETDWMIQVLRVMMGYEYMGSGNWKADNYRFVQPNMAKLYKDADYLAGTSFDLSLSINQQGANYQRADSNIMFEGVALASGEPNKVSIFSNVSGDEIKVKDLTISIRGGDFISGDSVLVPFHLIMYQ